MCLASALQNMFSAQVSENMCLWAQGDMAHVSENMWRLELSTETRALHIFCNAEAAVRHQESNNE